MPHFVSTERSWTVEGGSWFRTVNNSHEVHNVNNHTAQFPQTILPEPARISL